MNRWHEVNQQYLMHELGAVRSRLEQYVHQSDPEAIDPAVPFSGDDEFSLLALDRLCMAFQLSVFERHLLLLCAGIELDGSFAALCALAQEDAGKTYPTFSLAMATLPDAHWSAIAPTAPLRYWRLLDVGGGPALTLSPLRIDECVLHYLTGDAHLDERMAGLVEEVALGTPIKLQVSHTEMATRIATLWQRTDSIKTLTIGQVSPERSPIIQLCGSDVTSKHQIAIWACQKSDRQLCIMPAYVIPQSPGDFNQFLRLWHREAMLNRAVLLLDCDEMESGQGPATELAVTRLLESLNTPVIVSSLERRRSRHRPVVSFEVRSPTLTEQRQMWQEYLGDSTSQLNGQVESLVATFSLSATAIRAACLEVLSQPTLPLPGDEPLPWQHSASTPEGEAVALGSALWQSCRVQARQRMDELAQRLDTAAGWEDLILPEAQRQVLKDVTSHVRQRAKVYEGWGFGTRGARGLGISAMFAGASGTGKTMAAEVIAQELKLDLFRIDLSSIVSKYIGETEKNLRRVFDAAETGGCILLFDEADALFGKRSEVKDSHDRYANIEVGYLLQRMEAYRGLAILTTNLKDSIDQAFLRRIRFIVKFPFPDASQRADIWRRVFPPKTPIDKLDYGKLAQLNVAGGNIRNIAINAAFLAADAGESVSMKHILAAARSEYIKLERTLTEAEIKGWLM